MSRQGERQDLLPVMPKDAGNLRKVAILLICVAAVAVISCAAILSSPDADHQASELLMPERSRSAFFHNHVLGSRIRAPNQVSSFYGVDGQLFPHRHAQPDSRTHMLASEAEDESPEEPPAGDVPEESNPQEQGEETEVPETEGEETTPQADEVPKEQDGSEAPHDDEAEHEDEQEDVDMPADNQEEVSAEGEEAKPKEEEDKQVEDHGPSDFLQSIVEDVADHVMPKEANKILRSSDNSVKAAQSQLQRASHLKEEATAERVKAKLLEARLKKWEEYAAKQQERAKWFDQNAARAEDEAKAEQDEVDKEKAAVAAIEGSHASEEKLLQVVHRVVRKVTAGARGRTAGRRAGGK